MFVYHLKINGSKTFKIFFTGIVILVIVILGIVSFKIFHGANLSLSNSSCLPQNRITKLSSKNYTNILKTVHENLADYIGVKINFTGYIYRVLDTKENQFILARDMIVSSDLQSVVVGFLCESEKSKDLKEETWVEITGEITKGDYHGEMPIIKVTSIKKVEKPNDEFVYPPDDSYLPTSGIL
ncbi:MAG: hypothetical protein HFJ25_04615 [Clostridia bacterium]|nr:hypothetical protein [Clostridia bacterium]